MIAPDSTSYPTLAIIQRFNIPEGLRGLLYEAGHLAHQAMRRGGPVNYETVVSRLYPRGIVGGTMILFALTNNHRRAAEAHGYWAIDKETTK